MKIKKGTFKVAHAEGFQEQEGSYAIAFPLYIHRTEDEKLWKVEGTHSSIPPYSAVRALF